MLMFCFLISPAPLRQMQDFFLSNPTQKIAFDVRTEDRNTEISHDIGMLLYLVIRLPPPIDPKLHKNQ